jgi:hypothetical protein
MKGFIRPKTLLALALTGVAGTALLLADPPWWMTRGVRSQQVPSSDYSAINQGQLKNLARAARDEMNANFPGGAGQAIDDLIVSWGADTTQASDYSAASTGQVKALAKLFYDKLIEHQQATDYPWTTDIEDDKDYAVANIGQVKHIFSFLISDDFDGDGISNQDEVAYGLNPYVAETPPPSAPEPTYVDTDGDGISDADEALFGLNANADDFQARATIYTMSKVNRVEKVDPPGPLSQVIGYDKNGNITHILEDTTP